MISHYLPPFAPHDTPFVFMLTMHTYFIGLGGIHRSPPTEKW